MADLAGSPDIILVWPKGVELRTPRSLAGYSVSALAPENDRWWIDIHRRAIPSFAETDLEGWLTRYRSLALADGVLVAVEEASGEPVATAGSLANSKDGIFPRGGQLGWVATVPEHRGRGLATWLSALATERLLNEGFENTFLCTGDDLTTAIHVYLDLGYVPCLYASDQADRWERICKIIGHPFEPEAWPTRDDYLSS